jgi:hypothetical protein
MHVNTEREIWHEIITFWYVSLGSHGEILMHVNTEIEVYHEIITFWYVTLGHILL